MRQFADNVSELAAAHEGDGAVAQTEPSGDSAAEGSRAANRFSRRRLLARSLGLLAIPLAGTLYAREIEPFWLDIHVVPILVRGLPPAFEGFRVAQLTDLHIDDHVPTSYIRRVVRRVNEAGVDLVAITGDVVNHDQTWVLRASAMLGELTAPKVVSFGNHDYSPYGNRPGFMAVLANYQERELSRVGCQVLRNRSTYFERAGGQRLWVVGIEDMWSRLFSPVDAFEGLEPGMATIALSHNPDSAPYLVPFGPKLILSGHTHGGQIRIPLLGAPLLPIVDRRYDQGLFPLENDCQLYVSRGVGFLLRARFACRPEVPIFVLRRAPDHAPPADMRHMSA